MTRELQDTKVAILATDGVERTDLEQPRGALYGAGAQTELLSIHPGEIQARQFDTVSAGTSRSTVSWPTRPSTTTTRCSSPAAPSTRTSCG
jgi:putative intracellular protease/amidase